MRQEDVYKSASKEGKRSIMDLLAKNLKRYRFVKGALIFGSFVRRKYFRDLDVALITDREISQDRILEMEVDIGEKLGVEVDLKIFSELPLTYKFQVVASGRPLFLPAGFVRTKAAVVREYLDFEPFKEMNDRRILGYDRK